MTLSIRTRLLAGFVAIVAVVAAATFVLLDRTLGRGLVGDLDARLLQQARGVSNLFLAGSGDLHNAATVSEFAFERFAGLPTEAMSSMALGLYGSVTLPPGSVLIQMSFSGKTARAVEAATLARAREHGIEGDRHRNEESRGLFVRQIHAQTSSFTASAPCAPVHVR